MKSLLQPIKRGKYQRLVYIWVGKAWPKMDGRCIIVTYRGGPEMMQKWGIKVLPIGGTPSGETVHSFSVKGKVENL